MSDRGRAEAFPLEYTGYLRQIGMTIREYALIHIASGYAAVGVSPASVARYARETTDAMFGKEEEP